MSTPTNTATPPNKPKELNPYALSAKAKPWGNHFILYPTSKGYCFAMFYRLNEKAPFQIVASSHRPHRTKTACIRTMKMLMDGFGDLLFPDHKVAYDHRGNRIDMETKYDVKKLL